MTIICFKKELRDEFVRERTLDIKAKNEMKLKRDEQDKASSSQQKTSPPSQSGRLRPSRIPKSSTSPNFQKCKFLTNTSLSDK